MKAKFRLVSLQIGTPVKRKSIVDSFLGRTVEDEDEEYREVARATFTRVGGEDFEVLDISLDLEEAKMYMIGFEYEVNF